MARKRQKFQQTVKSTAPLIDIAITTAGRFDVLRTCLKSLKEQVDAPPFHISIVDDASDNVERLRNKELFEGIDNKRFTQRSGFPRAANEAARLGNAPIILFLSDDVELKPNVLKLMTDMMDDESIGIVGAKLLFPENTTTPNRPAGKVQHVGLGMNINGDFIHPLVGWSANNPKCCVTRDVIATTGACFMVRRSLYKKSGGFYEGYGKGTYEDCDLCFSIRALGKRVVVNTDAIAYHYTGATAEKLREPFPLQQNSLIFRARWSQSGLFEWTDYLFW